MAFVWWGTIARVEREQGHSMSEVHSDMLHAQDEQAGEERDSGREGSGAESMRQKRMGNSEAADVDAQKPVWDMLSELFRKTKVCVCGPRPLLFPSIL